MSGPEPTFDADGCPTDETLDRIREWPIRSLADFAAVMGFAGRAWSDRGWWERAELRDDPDRPMTAYRLATGGWSGNEAVVGAIRENPAVQSAGAWSWHRGGRYEYRFPAAADER